MKSLLILQHQASTTAGSTLEWAAQRNHAIHYWHPAEGGPAPEGQFDGVVICGGSVNTFEEDQNPWLRTEKMFLQKLIDQQTKIFGICLGAQLLAEALGGKVMAHSSGWEFGFVPVQTSEGHTLQVFQSHGCTFELPPQAELLATNDFCKNQAYRVGANIFATQFHPEATEEWIKYCADKDTSTRFGKVQSKDDILSSMSLQRPLQEWYFKQLDQFFQQ